MCVRHQNPIHLSNQSPSSRITFLINGPDTSTILILGGIFQEVHLYFIYLYIYIYIFYFLQNIGSSQIPQFRRVFSLCKYCYTKTSISKKIFNISLSSRQATKSHILCMWVFLKSLSILILLMFASRTECWCLHQLYSSLVQLIATFKTFSIILFIFLHIQLKIVTFLIFDNIDIEIVENQTKFGTDKYWYNCYI